MFLEEETRTLSQALKRDAAQPQSIRKGVNRKEIIFYLAVQL